MGKAHRHRHTRKQARTEEHQFHLYEVKEQVNESILLKVRIVVTSRDMLTRRGKESSNILKNVLYLVLESSYTEL